MLWLSILMTSLVLYGCDQPRQEPKQWQVAQVLGDASHEGFARATELRQFQFPQDHGPHPAYRNEWWYITGNLQAEDGREFGFQVTFFRIALQPNAIESVSAWRTNQIWMAHAALTDLNQGEHLAYERFARQGAGLAGATAEPFRVWLEDWQLQAEEGSDIWRLQLANEGFDLRLSFSPLSPVVLQGRGGLSQKSEEPGNASYYYSIPRLQADGRIEARGESIRVTGLAWLDREWSTSALGPAQAGWDWFSLQLNDGRNLMYYQLRRKDGAIDPHSAGSLSDANGLRQSLGAEQVSLTPVSYWQSGDRRYPIEWRMQLQSEPHPWRVYQGWCGRRGRSCIFRFVLAADRL